MTKVTSGEIEEGLNLPIIPGTLRNSSNIPNPIYNLNKHEFHAQFAHVDFVWAPFSHRSDTLVLGIKPRWSSPNLRPLYWRLAPAEWAAAKFFTWGLKSSSSDLCHSAPGSVSAQRSPVTCRRPRSNTTNAFSKYSQCWSEQNIVDFRRSYQINFNWISCAAMWALMTCCYWRPDFYPLLLQPIFHFSFLGGGPFTTPLFAFVSVKFLENATGLVKTMGVRAETSIYQLSVSQAAFKNHYSLIQHMCQGRPAG